MLAILRVADVTVPRRLKEALLTHSTCDHVFFRTDAIDPIDLTVGVSSVTGALPSP